MPLPVLLLSPDQQGYSIPAGHDTISTQLDGGAGRYRADQLGASFPATVQWTMNKTNYNYLRAFYRTATKKGSLPFTISLLLDSGDMQTYTAYFVPDSFGLTSQAGETFVCGATLEILDNAAYAVNDATILAAGPDV